MSESFADLLNESLINVEMKPGSIVKATVVKIDSDYVTVSAGLKSEGLIGIAQFKNEQGAIDINEGDVVDVSLEAVEDGFGETILSRDKAKRAESWTALARAHDGDEVVTGIITGKVKGGFTVELANIRAFLPGSLVDVRPVRDTSYLEGKPLEFKVIKLDQKRNNVVVSRRSVVESEGQADRDALLESLQEGQEIKGVVKNLTDYGAFVDLGGIDGLLHITDMSWKRVKHPSEIVNVGDELNVKVLKFDRERNRVSLGMKQLGDDPWVDLTRRYPEGTRLKGKVTNITDYGCFVEIEEGVEGLVHMSEMDWTNKNVHPNKIVSLDQEVEVLVLDIDEERRRISLGIKQCIDNPWDKFSAEHKVGEKVKGNIKSITDFGIFIGLEGAIDGLIHLSDVSWDDEGDEAVRQYKKGDEVEAVILAIDPDRERISLGLKQMISDPFTTFAESVSKGAIVKGNVIDVEQKVATIEIAENVHAILKIAEFSREKVSDLRENLKVGEEVEGKLTNVDKKNRTLSFSIKAKDSADEKQAMRELSESNEAVQGATLGDLLKEKMTGTPEESSEEKS